MLYEILFHFEVVFCGIMQLGYLMEQHIFTLNKHSGMLICFSLVV